MSCSNVTFGMVHHITQTLQGLPMVIVGSFFISVCESRGRTETPKKYNNKTHQHIQPILYINKTYSLQTFSTQNWSPYFHKPTEIGHGRLYLIVFDAAIKLLMPASTTQRKGMHVIAHAIYQLGYRTIAIQQKPMNLEYTPSYTHSIGPTVHGIQDMLWYYTCLANRVYRVARICIAALLTLSPHAKLRGSEDAQRGGEYAKSEIKTLKNQINNR